MFRRRYEFSPMGLDVAAGAGGAARGGTEGGLGGCVRAAQLRRDRRNPDAPPQIVAIAHLAAPPHRGSVTGAIVDTSTSSTSPGPGADLSAGYIASMLGVLARQGFVGDRVVLHMPQRHILSAALDVPPRSSGAPLDVICRNELARVHRLEPDQIECGWWELPPVPFGGAGGGGGAGRDATAPAAQAMAVGCRSTDAEGLIATFDAAGAQVCAIDARGPALARAGGRLILPAPALTAVLEWDWEAALVVIVRGDTVVYERCLAEAGLSFVYSAMARKLKIDPDVALHLLQRVGLGQPSDELGEDTELVGQAQRLITEHLDSMALELRASAAYASRRFGNAVGRVLLCGEGAAVPLAPDRIERHLEAPMQVLTPGELFPLVQTDQPVQAHAQGPRAAGLAVALGLAAFPTEALA